jgi:ATP-dependent DNA helicase RecG
MSVEQLEEGISRVRNRAIMTVLQRLGYVEKHGTAYAKAVAAAERGYPLPEWTEPGPILRVTLKPQRLKAETTAGAGRERRDRRPDVLRLLAEGEMSPKEMAAALGNISPRQLRRVLAELRDDGEIEPNEAGPQSPRRKYRLVGRSSS